MNKLALIALVIVIASLVYAVVYQANMPNFAPGSVGKIFKVNSINYSGNNSVQVYFISWYGCPNGATSSWVLYLALSKFGNVSVEPHGSRFYLQFHSAVPGLIFTGFMPNSTVYFHYVYMYNQYLNATATGIPINNTVQAIKLGLDTVKNSTPSWVYNIVYYYQIEDKLVSTGNGSIAFSSGHLVTMGIITGPKGTYAFLAFPDQISPQLLLQSLGLSSLSTEQAQNVASQILYNITDGKQIPTVILQAENNFLSLIEEELS